MKRVIQFLSVLIFIDLITIAFLNIDTHVRFTFVPNTTPISINITYLLTTFILGGVTTMALAYYTDRRELEKKISKKERAVEVSSIKSEENSDKVQLLEEKIKTLETALEESLKQD